MFILLTYSPHQIDDALEDKDSEQKQYSRGGKPNPFYRQIVFLALKSAADGVGRYFKPELAVGKGSSFSTAARAQVLVYTA